MLPEFIEVRHCHGILFEVSRDRTKIRKLCKKCKEYVIINLIDLAPKPPSEQAVKGSSYEKPLAGCGADHAR